MTRSAARVAASDSTATTTRLEKVHAGQRVRLTARGGEYRRVTDHRSGICHGIRLEFDDGDSLTATPATPVDVLV